MRAWLQWIVDVWRFLGDVAWAAFSKHPPTTTDVDLTAPASEDERELIDLTWRGKVSEAQRSVFFVQRGMVRFEEGMELTAAQFEEARRQFEAQRELNRQADEEGEDE